MRKTTLTTFRKLYGKIEVDLEAYDEILIVIENNYNTYEFEERSEWFYQPQHGKSNFLGMVYIIVGGFCMVYSLIFRVIYATKPRSAIIFHINLFSSSLYIILQLFYLYSHW
jgi:hypothetical protein